MKPFKLLLLAIFLVLRSNYGTSESSGENVDEVLDELHGHGHESATGNKDKRCNDFDSLLGGIRNPRFLPLALSRRDVQDNFQKRQCEACRAMRCKGAPCDLCGKFCSNHLPRQEPPNPLDQIVGMSSRFGEPQPDGLGENEDRYYTIGSFGPGPLQSLMKKLLNIDRDMTIDRLVVLGKKSKATGVDAAPVIIDTAHVFTQNNGKPAELELELHNVKNLKGSDIEDLTNSLNTALDTAVETKKELKGDPHLTPDEIDQIIDHTVQQHNNKPKARNHEMGNEMVGQAPTLEENTTTRQNKTLHPFPKIVRHDPLFSSFLSHRDKKLHPQNGTLEPNAIENVEFPDNNHPKVKPHSPLFSEYLNNRDKLTQETAAKGVEHISPIQKVVAPIQEVTPKQENQDVTAKQEVTPKQEQAVENTTPNHQPIENRSQIGENSTPKDVVISPQEQTAQAPVKPQNDQATEPNPQGPAKARGDEDSSSEEDDVLGTKFKKLKHKGKKHHGKGHFRNSLGEDPKQENVNARFKPPSYANPKNDYQHHSPLPVDTHYVQGHGSEGYAGPTQPSYGAGANGYNQQPSHNYQEAHYQAPVGTYGGNDHQYPEAAGAQYQEPAGGYANGGNQYQEAMGGGNQYQEPLNSYNQPPVNYQPIQTGDQYHKEPSNNQYPNQGIPQYQAPATYSAPAEYGQQSNQYPPPEIYQNAYAPQESYDAPESYQPQYPQGNDYQEQADDYAPVQSLSDYQTEGAYHHGNDNYRLSATAPDTKDVPESVTNTEWYKQKYDELKQWVQSNMDAVPDKFPKLDLASKPTATPELKQRMLQDEDATPHKPEKKDNETVGTGLFDDDEEHMYLSPYGNHNRGGYGYGYPYAGYPYRSNDDDEATKNPLLEGLDKILHPKLPTQENIMSTLDKILHPKALNDIQEKIEEQYEPINEEFGGEEQARLGSSHDVSEENKANPMDTVHKNIKNVQENIHKPLLTATDGIASNTFTNDEPTRMPGLKKLVPEKDLQQMQQRAPIMQQNSRNVETVPQRPQNADLIERPQHNLGMPSGHHGSHKHHLPPKHHPVEQVGMPYSMDRILGNPQQPATFDHTQFGKIIPQHSMHLHNRDVSDQMKNKEKVYFLGEGMKLPLYLIKQTDGSMHLSIDVDKLCNCTATPCNRQHVTPMPNSIPLDKASTEKIKRSIKNHDFDTKQLESGMGQVAKDIKKYCKNEEEIKENIGKEDNEEYMSSIKKRANLLRNVLSGMRDVVVENAEKSS